MGPHGLHTCMCVCVCVSWCLSEQVSWQCVWPWGVRSGGTSVALFSCSGLMNALRWYRHGFHRVPLLTRFAAVKQDSPRHGLKPIPCPEVAIAACTSPQPVCRGLCLGSDLSLGASFPPWTRGTLFLTSSSSPRQTGPACGPGSVVLNVCNL